MSASTEAVRIETLRAFSRRGWQSIPHAQNNKAGIRALNWLSERGFLEQHPERYLSDYQITDAGIEYLAQAGGDVTGTGW